MYADIRSTSLYSSISSINASPTIENTDFDVKTIEIFRDDNHGMKNRSFTWQLEAHQFYKAQNPFKTVFVTSPKYGLQKISIERTDKKLKSNVSFGHNSDGKKTEVDCLMRSIS